MKAAEPRLSTSDTAVMRAMRSGPIWIRSLGGYKAIADRLCDLKLVERITPPGGRARNQMQLTEAGRRRLAAESHR